jgi:hypothetical protein
VVQKLQKYLFMLEIKRRSLERNPILDDRLVILYILYEQVPGDHLSWASLSFSSYKALKADYLFLLISYLTTPVCQLNPEIPDC